MIHKSNAIVLRYYPTQNTSRIVVWLSETLGCITTLIKGAQRPKSMFIGQFDTFYTCELLCYPREHKQVYHTREVTPLHCRARFRTDWRACALASYFSYIMYHIHPERARHESMYPLLEKGLDLLHEKGASVGIMIWFELHVLQVLGLAPDFSPRKQMRKPCLAIAEGTVFDDAENPSHALVGQSISPGVWKMLAAWQGVDGWKLSQTTKCTLGQQRELQALLGPFLAYHLGIDLGPRNQAFATLNRSVPLLESIPE